MDTYLLLRSNKETGPYSYEQLINLGLKPYDLVWVVNKSAAWRYPSEIENLKEFAPAIEEQPYDRFYKKAEEEKKEEEVVQSSSTSSTQIKHEEPEKSYPTKKVFVAMPENYSSKKQVKETPSIIYEKKSTPVIIPVKKSNPQPVEDINSQFARDINEQPAIKNEPVFLKEEHSESLDEIKKRYAATYLDRKKKNKRGSAYTAIFQVVGGAVFFCALVVIAYRNFAGEETAEKPKPVVSKQEKKNEEPETDPGKISIVNTQPVVPEENNVKKEEVAKSEPNFINEKDEPNIVVSRKTTEKTVTPIMTDEPTQTKKAVMPPATERNSTVLKSEKPKVKIATLVNVKANDYKQRAFGGVVNLELTVNNNSSFALDKVVVQLSYLKPSEETLKTDEIVFNGISPNGSQTLKIPDYNRGIKVTYKITTIESSDYETYTAGL